MANEGKRPASRSAAEEKKNATETKAPEPVPQPAAVEQPKQEVKAVSPYARLHEIWALSNPFQQRAKALEIFGLADGAGVCVAGIVADEFYYDLLFCQQSGFSRTQTRVFIDLIKGITEQITQGATAPQAFASFKAALLQYISTGENSKIADYDAEREKAAAQIAEQRRKLEEEEAAKKAAEEEEKKAKKPKPTSAKTRKAQEDEAKALEEQRAAALAKADAEAKALAEEALQPLLVFTVDMVQRITDYVINGIFANYRLYVAVLCGKSARRKRVVGESLYLETVVPFSLSLSEAEEFQREVLKPAAAVESAPAAAGAPEPQLSTVAAVSGDSSSSSPSSAAPSSSLEPGAGSEDAVNADMQEKLNAARAAMDKKLQENAAALEQRLRAIEQTLAQRPRK